MLCVNLSQASPVCALSKINVGFSMVEHRCKANVCFHSSDLAATCSYVNKVDLQDVVRYIN